MNLDKINKLSNYFNQISEKKPKATSGGKSPLVSLFKAAQEQIVKATLDCTDLEETKNCLETLIQSTQSMKQTYKHGSRNLLVKIGLIKPRGMKEAFYNADAVISKAQAALNILPELQIAHSFELKEHLKALEGDDPQILIRLLEQSGEGEPFESCRVELEELATEQFLQLARVIYSAGRRECVFNRGKWRLKSSKLSPEERRTLKSDQVLQYLPYVSFDDMKRSNFWRYEHTLLCNRLERLKDPRIQFLVQIFIKGIGPVLLLNTLDNVSPDLVPVFLRIAKDANHPSLKTKALLLDHLKERAPLEWSKFYKFFNEATAIQDRLDQGKFQAGDLSILWDLIHSGILDNKLLVQAAPLSLPLYANLLHLDETHGGQNFDMRAVQFTLRALKEGAMENIAEATTLLDSILGLKEFEKLDGNCFPIFSKLQELKAFESPFENELRELLPQLSEMEEKVCQPAEQDEPFAVSAMRYALESPTTSSLKLFENLISAHDLDDKYPLMESLPKRLKELASFFDAPTVAFLEKKSPYIAHVIKILQMRTHQGLDSKTLLPIDLQLELHKTLQMQPVVTFEEENLVNPKKLDPTIEIEIMEIGRIFGKLPFMARADIDDSWVQKHEANLFKIGVKKVDLRGTAVTPEYAQALQAKYKIVEYDDSYTTRKQWLDSNRGDYTLKVGNLQRQVFKDLIFQACPEGKITTYDQWLSIPGELSEEELNAFLEFCYTGAMSNVSDALLISLFAKADQLGSELLKDYCYRLLIATTTKSNVLDRFKAAKKTAPSLIAQYLVRFVKAHCRTQQEGFNEMDKEEILRIAKIVLDFPPLDPPKHVHYVPELHAEHNFTVKSERGVIFEGNLSLLGLRSGYFRTLENFRGGEKFKSEGSFKFDDRLLSNVMRFLNNGDWPGDLAELSAEDLQSIWDAADFFDIPLLKFKIGQIEGIEFEGIVANEKKTLPATAITPSDWTAWGLEGVDEEWAFKLLPEDIDEILSQPSSLHPGHTVGEKHLLVWVPEDFSIEKLRAIVRKRTTTQTPPHMSTVTLVEALEPAFLRKKTKGHWTLISTDIIPASYNRSPEAQEALLQEKSSELVRYEIPEVIDLATAVYAKFLKTSDQVIKYFPRGGGGGDYALCKELHEGRNLIIGSYDGRFSISYRGTHGAHPTVGVIPAVVLL